MIKCKAIMCKLLFKLSCEHLYFWWPSTFCWPLTFWTGVRVVDRQDRTSAWTLSAHEPVSRSHQVARVPVHDHCWHLHKTQEGGSTFFKLFVFCRVRWLFKLKTKFIRLFLFNIFDILDFRLYFSKFYFRYLKYYPLFILKWLIV